MTLLFTYEVQYPTNHFLKKKNLTKRVFFGLKDTNLKLLSH